MLAALQGREPLARYDGYGACPFTTARGRMLLAELDYSLTPHPTLAFIDTQRDATTCGSSSATSFPPSPGVSWTPVSAERAAGLSRLLLKRPGEAAEEGASCRPPPLLEHGNRRPHRDAVEAEGALGVQLGPFRVDGLG